MVETLATWATILSSGLALLAIAWSAVNYIQIRRIEIKHQEYQKFFEIMDHLGSQGNSIASKVAAAHELRKYPQYTDVIVRLADQVEISGSAAAMLKNELDLTAKFLMSK
jgi:hypothetical protein